MEYLIYIVTALILIRYLNQYRIKLYTLKTQNQLLELKNEVMNSYLEGKMKASKHQIEEFKSIISGTESVLPKLHVWSMLYSWKITKVEVRINSIKEYNKDLIECPELSKAYTKYSEISAKYLFNKSVFSVVTIGIAIFIGKHVSSRCSRFIVRIKDSIKYNLVLRNNNITPSI